MLQSCGELHVRVPATATVLPSNLDVIDDAQIEISAMKLKLLSFFAFAPG